MKKCRLAKCANLSHCLEKLVSFLGIMALLVGERTANQHSNNRSSTNLLAAMFFCRYTPENSSRGKYSTYLIGVRVIVSGSGRGP